MTVFLDVTVMDVLAFKCHGCPDTCPLWAIWSMDHSDYLIGVPVMRRMPRIVSRRNRLPLDTCDLEIKHHKTKGLHTQARF